MIKTEPLMPINTNFDGEREIPEDSVAEEEEMEHVSYSHHSHTLSIPDSNVGLKQEDILDPVNQENFNSHKILNQVE
jgi:hypothetical protein